MYLMHCWSLFLDDEAIAAPDQNLSELGTIELSVTRVELTRSKAPSFDAPPQLNDAAIHERSKKMSMHRVTLVPLWLMFEALTDECAPNAGFKELKSSLIHTNSIPREPWNRYLMHDSCSNTDRGASIFNLFAKELRRINIIFYRVSPCARDSTRRQCA